MSRREATPEAEKRADPASSSGRAENWSESGAEDASNSSAKAERPAGHWSHHLGGFIALGFKLLKSAKMVKLALFGASAASYAWLWSWETAFVLIYALFIHELGHVKAMRWMGLPTKGMYFLPFLGAVAVGDVSRSRFEEAFIAFMGPLFGVLSLGPLVVVASMSGDPKWWGYIGLACLLNLFNLLPIGFLDGGRIVNAITHSIGRRIGLVAFVATIIAGAVLVSYNGSITLGFILGVSAIEYARDLRRSGRSSVPAMTPKEIVVSSAAYILIFALFLAVITVSAGHPGGDFAHALIRD